jgi:SAM-dependent methyltransferase
MSRSLPKEITPIIDRVRQYWDGRPCNIRHSGKPVGSREFFDEVEARKYFVEQHIPKFAQFSRWNGKKVLEIGSGIGTDSVNFARAGAQITCVDISSESLAICRRRFEVFGLKGRFYQGNAEELSTFVPIEPYDLIYSFGVIHHTPNPDRVLQELLRYCGPNSEIRLMLYSKWSWKVLWILVRHGFGAFWRLGSLVRQNSEAETGCPVTYVYSSEDVHRLLRGYRVLEIRKDHIFPYVISRYVRHEYQWVWYFKWIPRRWFRWLEHRAGWHTLIIARPRAANNAGLGALRSPLSN